MSTTIEQRDLPGKRAPVASTLVSSITNPPDSSDVGDPKEVPKAEKRRVVDRPAWPRVERVISKEGIAVERRQSGQGDQEGAEGHPARDRRIP